LKKDEVLHVAIGQRGSFTSGSGGTFVIRECSNGSFDPIVIAGGAGGDPFKNKNPWCNAQLSTFGNGSKYGVINKNIGGSGKSSQTDGYNGGAGYKTNASNSTENYPKCFQDGLQGGTSYSLHDGKYTGGFGGGGCGGAGSRRMNNGGGGGYTGGNGSPDWGIPGGGGGSFNTDPKGTKTLGWFEEGKCEIKFI